MKKNIQGLVLLGLLICLAPLAQATPGDKGTVLAGAWKIRDVVEVGEVTCCGATMKVDVPIGDLGENVVPLPRVVIREPGTNRQDCLIFDLQDFAHFRDTAEKVAGATGTKQLVEVGRANTCIVLMRTNLHRTAVLGKITTPERQGAIATFDTKSGEMVAAVGWDLNPQAGHTGWPAVLKLLRRVDPVLKSYLEARNNSRAASGQGSELKVSDFAAVRLVLQIWRDKVGGEPFNPEKPRAEFLLLLDGEDLPGVRAMAKNLAIGKTLTSSISLGELIGPNTGRTFDPNQQVLVRLHVSEGFPEEEFSVKTKQAGSGERVSKKGDTISVEYTERLGGEFGEIVHETKGKPYRFKLGEGKVIPGWERGLLGMKKGEKRVLSIPHYLGYGYEGRGVDIPSKSRLHYTVTLTNFED